MDPAFWAWLVLLTIVFLALAWALDTTFSQLDRLPREPRNAPRTRRELYRPPPAAGEERE